MKWTKLAAKLVLLIVLIVGAIGWRVISRENAAVAAYPPEGKFVTIDGRRVHAVVKGSGLDLVLIHGSSGNTRDFTFGLLDHLTDRYRVIVFDRPGLGYSDRLDRGAEGIHEQAAQLRAAAGALGATRPIVLGQSYGAAVALAWALDAPDSVAAVVNVSGPSHPWNTPLSLVNRIGSNPMGATFVVPLMTALVTQDYVNTAIAETFRPQMVPDGYADYFGIPLTLRRGSLRANASHRATLLEEIIALRPRYADFPVPLELLHGTLDVTVPTFNHADRMVTETPQARLMLLQGVGHMPHHSHPEAVVAAIDRAARRAGLN